MSATVAERCQAAKAAQPALATATTALKNAVLARVATLLVERAPALIEENAKDLAAGEEAGLSKAMIDRLRLTRERLGSMADGVREIAALADPIGAVANLSRRPNGLQVGRMRIPLGVVAMVFESRPNVVIDAGTLCLKSGNAVILKGGKEAQHSNVALAQVLADALEAEGLPRDAVVLLTGRSEVAELLEQEGTVDLVIPRGGEGLIRYVTHNSRIPVIQHYKGVCHVYVDETADAEMAHAIVVNAKVQRPGVCNACETLLVHGNVPAEFLHGLITDLQALGVEIRGCERTCALVDGLTPATEEDWDTEYLDLILSVRVVDDLDAAIQHIRLHGSDHTEAIVTNNYSRANEFVARIPSSATIVNASTRFNDGGQLGLGAEIGISTSRLHAFGPMGLNELTATKFVVYGTGQVRA